MVKSNLREQGYFVIEKFPKESKINTMWAILTVIIIIGTFTSLFFLSGPEVGILENSHGPAAPRMDMLIILIESAGSVLTLGLMDSEVAGYFIFAVFTLFLYLFMKLFMTILFCHRSDSIKMRFLENKGMPLCYCREALRVWQTVLIYFLPFILMYCSYFYLCLRYIAYPAFVIIFFFMMFFMVFDLVLVLYVLRINAKEKPDYISIDFHIYGYTLYNKTYVKFNSKKKKRKRKIPDALSVEQSEKNIKNGKFNWKNHNQNINFLKK